MTDRLIIQREKFYLAFQDGPVDNRTYDTLEEAEAELATWDKLNRQSTMIRSRISYIDAMTGKNIII